MTFHPVGPSRSTASNAVDWINVVNANGADPTGTVDSSTAIQNAINTAALATVPNGAVVYIPTGTYLVTSSLTPASNVRVRGDGKVATTIKSTTVSIWNMGTAGLTQNFELDHMTLDQTGADLFSGSNLTKGYFHDNQFIQRTAANAIWNGTALTQMIECRFERNDHFAHGATRSIAAWFLSSSSAAVINQNVWRDEVVFNSDDDHTQWLFQIVCSAAAAGSGQRDNTFENIVFEFPTGGMIRLESCSGTIISNVSAFDIASLTVGNSLISLVKNASAGTGCRSTIITGYNRLGGASLSGNFDIQSDANSAQTTIIAPSLNAGGAGLAFDLGSSAQVTLSGFPASYTLTNATGATFADLNGAAWESGNTPQPEDLGYIAWAYDCAMPSGTGGTLGGAGAASAGQLQLIKVPIRSTKSCTGISVQLTTAGGTLTAGQCFAGLFTSAGVFIGSTADQSTPWAGATGLQNMNLASGPFQVSPPFVWVALLYNGTTGPSFLRTGNLTAGYANGQLTAANSRFGHVGTGLTSITSAANFTPSTIAQLSVEFWAALF